MRVLVIGGTQFMGRLVVEGLLQAGHTVVLLNRGRTVNPFEDNPRCKAVKCDRMTERDAFTDAVRGIGTTDAVVDFIGFQEAYVQDTVDGLTVQGGDAGGSGGKRFLTRHYVFISSDSVYWAQKLLCLDARLPEEAGQDFTPEEFDRHLDEHCKLTSLGEYQLRYGGNKLGCEAVLQEAEGLPYTILRLPDVYGPYDNLGGFWDLVEAVEMGRPIPVRLQPGRVRQRTGQDPQDPAPRRFSWAFAEDVRDAILACLGKGSDVHGMVMHVAHEEATTVRETAAMIAEAMEVPVSSLRFDEERNAQLPSTDFGALDVAKALRKLKPWRPTAMRQAVRRSVKWFLSSRQNRRYHRLVHREPRFYDETNVRPFLSTMCEVRTCWVGDPKKAAYLKDGPVVLCDALPNFTGQEVLGFMERLMDQVGDTQVCCEVQRGADVERQTWALRHFAGHLLQQSQHSAAYRLPGSHALESTDMLPELASPLAGVRRDEAGQPPPRLLNLGGTGARTSLRRVDAGECPNGGLWDCALLGRRKWRLFPPETPPSALCLADNRSGESPVDCFAAGPEQAMVQLQHQGFSPAVCWECEQTMGEAIVVPNGWWYQTYDDDRTLSVSAFYGGPCLDEVGAGDSRAQQAGMEKAPPTFAPPSRQSPSASPPAGGSREREESPEVLEWELAD